VPAYVKMYVVKYGRKYRMAVFAAPDSAAGAVKKYGDRLMTEAGKFVPRVQNGLQRRV